MNRPTEIAAVDALRRHFGGRATQEPARLAAASWDFGALVERAPLVVVEPETDEDVLLVLRIASDHRVSVALRGSGHSQSGQGLSERSITIDTRRLSSLRVDSKERTVVAGAGVTWRRIVDAAFQVSLLPEGLTLVVDTTCGGTLSVGGVGGESWRIGAQVNNVLSLDVATLDGKVLTCSATENRDVFDCVRGGLGQCGVILRATYPLRACKRNLRTYFFVYDDAEPWVTDLGRIRTEARGDLVLGFVTPTRTGKKKGSILLAVGKEFDDEGELDDASMRSTLHPEKELPSNDWPLWADNGVPGHLFFRLHAETPWNTGGAPPFSHPWVDHVFTPGAAIEVLDGLLGTFPAPLRMGTCGLIPVAVSGEHAPLFSLPGSDGLLIGVGMFPNVPSMLKDGAAAIMSDYSKKYCDAGGRRYLSGFVDFTSEAAWAEHYGEAWPWFRRMKQRFDPHGLLSPGFLNWGPSGTQ